MRQESNTSALLNNLALKSFLCMLLLFESINLITSRSHKRTVISTSQGGSRSMDWFKDCPLLLVLEGQRRGWINHVLGLTRMSLTSWIHTVNGRGVAALRPNPRPGKPGQSTLSVREEISNHLQKSPQEFDLPRARWYAAH